MLNHMIRLFGVANDLYKMDLKMRTHDWMQAKANGSRPRPKKNMNTVRRRTKRRHNRGA